jgi:hypothetical protein
MGRGARIIRTGGRIVVSIPSSNVRRRGREMADSATATPGQGMAPNDEVGVEPSLLLHRLAGCSV